MNVRAGREDAAVSFTYWENKIPPELARSIKRTFSTVLAEITTRPDVPVSEVNMVSAADLVQIMDWNSPPAATVSACIHDMVREECIAHPDRLAIDAWDGSFTYQQLWDHSSSLVACLIDQGVGPEMPVPICLERSAWVPVSKLAVLRAGGICVPLDPSAPVERIQAMLEEATPEIIIVSSTTANIDFQSNARKIVISSDMFAHSAAQLLDPSSPVQPSNGAYILYTSGSTGRPKGIILQHDGLSTSIREQSRRLSINGETRALQFASYTFDVSVWEIFAVLTSGGCVCIPSQMARMNELATFISTVKVNWVAFTPSFVRLFQPKDFPSVRTMILTGENLPQDIAETWCNKVELVNAYGPTECTICTTQPVEAGRWTMGTIGWPVGGSGWVVDPSNINRPMPIGAIGELIFEGPVVAREYFRRPDATEISFVSARPSWLPTSSYNGCRLYRTGDLVHYNPDGSLRYLGRKDSQIKLRGHRIELEEAEFLIRRYLPPGYNVVVDVIHPTDQARSSILIAFLCNEADTSQNLPPQSLLMPASDSFRSLSQDIQMKLPLSIPNHMIPQLMIQISMIPRTKSGKTNRRIIRVAASRLSRTDLEVLVDTRGGSGKMQPTTPNEKLMQSLWATALDLPTESVGVSDNLFQLGGDSITAMKIVGLTRAAGYTLVVSDIFSRPSLSRLAEGLQRRDLSSVQNSAPFSLIPSEEKAEALIEIAMNECQASSDDIEDIYPCTALQEGLVSLTIKQQGSYVAQYQHRIDPGVDIPRLAAAWDMVVAANPILRTRIIQSQSARTFQVVLKHGPTCVIESSSFEETMKATKEARIALGASLLQCVIISQESETFLVLTIHHAVYDGWSMTLLLEQLESAYAGQSLKPRPFTGFVEYLSRVDISASDKFWRSQFTDLNCAVFPTPSVQLNRANMATTLQLVEHRLETPSVGSKFTLSTIVRLAWAMVLSKHTDSRDVVFGATVAGRSAPVADIEQMTGPTMATVPFRVSINPAESVLESLENVQARTIDMIPYEATGLHNIKALGADAAVACQFQNLLVIQQQQSFYQPKLMHEVQRFTENIAAINTYPLTLLCNLNGDHILIQASFDSEVLSKAETETLCYHLGQAILQLVEKQSLNVSDIDLVGPETIQQLQAWNQNIPPQMDGLVHEVIDGYCKSQPQAPAVCSWDGDLSYSELDSLSSQLAEVLIERGVGPEVLIPVYLEKCKWTPIAMLAIMLAGGAFVLMDPAHPLDRLKLIHSQLDAPVLLTSTSLSSAALKIASTVIPLDSDGWQEEADNKSTTPKVWRASGVQPNNRVYAVFTSGTTGTPKGVVIEHAACLTSMQALIGPMGIDRNTRALQVASYAFDVSVSDHLATLLAGGCICIPQASQRENNLALAVEGLQANYMHITPSLAELLRPEDVPGLRTLVLSGEPMTAGLVTTWAGAVKLVNAYGPAECSVDCFVNASITSTTDHSNIGYATGSVGWIVDQEDHDKLAPIGTVGELVVEGAILSRGYLNDEQKTSAAFIEDPAWVRRFPLKSGPRRLYKTGDLVHYHPNNGSMCYVGRKDTQVKVRGQRLELGEIEHYLKECFAEATRLMVDLIVPISDDERPALMAFIEIPSEYHDLRGEASAHGLFNQPSDTFRAKVQTVVAQLRKKLPPAMVPATFIPVVKIPLSSSGKTERKTVRQAASRLAREEKRHYMAASKVKRAPTTKTERLVQSISGRVLKVPVEDIGMNDTFFEHGGDSISAIRFVGDARQAGWTVQVVDIFSEPTLAALAGKMHRSEGDLTARPIPPFLLLPDETEISRLCSLVASSCSISTDRIQDIYPATALQAGLLALSLKQQGAYQGYFPIRLPSGVDLDSIKKAWESTVKANVILRTRIVQDADGQLYQAVLDSEVEWHEAANLDEYFKGEASIPIRMGGPLARAAIVQDSKQGGWYLVVTLHHALYDGWSIPMLVQDLQTAYIGQMLSPRPFNGFVDYICRADDVASSEFWRNEFEGLSCEQFPQLPSAHHVPSIDGFLEHTLALRGLSSDFTISTIVRLAWATVISSYSSSDDVVFGTTVAGRSAPVPGIENMTGPTIATVPIRVRVDPNMCTKDALGDIRTRGTQMIRFEQTGLQSIRSLSPEAALACQFQSLLVIQWINEESTESSDFSVAYEYAHDEKAFSSYAINLTCDLASSAIKFRVAFDSHITEPAVMQMMLFQLSNAISRIMDNAMFVRDLKEISPQGMQSLLTRNTHLPPRVQACVHDLILSYSENTPDAIAVDAWDGTLTYRELDSSSSSLSAHLLSSAQVKPETIVPLLSEKSMNTAIALLGVMRAGLAFLLLDPSQPAPRLKSLCEAVEAKIIVASARHADLASTLVPEARVVVCSRQDLVSSGFPNGVALPVPVSDPRQIAYCVFTSGSTGTPKCILIEHSSFCTSSLAVGRLIGMDQSTRVFQFASYAFDVSITDHLLPLMHGGSIFIPHSENVKNNLPASLRESCANFAELTPSVARMLDVGDVSSLQILVMSGEAMTQADVEKWQDKVRLINLYGPAECSCAATGQNPVSLSHPPQVLGKGMGGVCWVVDPADDEQLVPIGAIGELIIEGPIVGRGYLNAPELTASVFVPSMRWLQRVRGEEDRVYKTGDLVQLLPTGDLKYIGRKDLQVKIHGQRIELGDVEHHVHHLFPQATNVAAEVLHPNEQQRKSILAAFLEVPHLQKLPNGHSSSTEMSILPATASFLADVQRAESKLRDTIPPYMIPTLFLPVNRIALSLSGKVNRGLLQNLGRNLNRKDIKAFINPHRTKRAPETEMQRALGMLCAKVLNLPLGEVSIDDSFLALGGDSISAMSLVARASALQIAMSVGDVLTQSTIEKLASRAKNTTALLLPQPEELDVSFALSPIQEMFFDVVPQESHNHYNQSFFLSLARNVSVEDLEDAVHGVVRHHVMLRARFSQDAEGLWTQSITSQPESSSPYLFKSHEVADVASIEPHALKTQQSLNIVSGPLLAVDLYQVHGQGQYILLVAHHLVVDHVSWRIILSDLEESLEASSASNARGCRNIESSLSFQSWCHLQAQHVREQLPPQKVYPTPTESHVPPSTTFTCMDYWGLTSRSNTCSDVVSIGFTLDAEVTESLLGHANDALRTRPVEIIQAALIYSFMKQFPDRDAPIIYSEGHGREVWDPSIDLSRTVGWFTTIWPTLITVHPTHSLIEVVKRTKDGRRQVRNNGWAYFSSRFLHPAGRSQLPLEVPLEIVFNYAGSFQQLEQRHGLFHMAETQYTRFDVAATAIRFELFDVSAVVNRGQLQVEISYHQAMPQDRIRQWGSSFEAALREASVKLQEIQRQFTLADFPLLQIGYSDLAHLVDTVVTVAEVHDITEIEDAYPCSSIQLGMLLSQAKDAAQYITSTTWEVQTMEGIDVDRFIRSWHKVVNHNPILRTIFVESHSGQLWDQVVLRHSAGDVILADADGINSPVSQGFGSVTASRPWQLIVTRAGVALLCELRILHALVDGFSTSLLEQQLSRAYGDQTFSEPVATLKDYISYVQSLPSGVATQFWATYLEGSDHCILPTLHHSQDPNYPGSVSYVTRKLDDLRPLQVFCGENGVTLFSLVQLAWGLVLRAYTASDAVCFGYLVTGRNMPIAGIDKVIGPLINILVSKMHLDGSNAIADLVRSIHSDFLRGLGHQHTSLAEIYHSLGISGRGLFNTVVSVQTKSEQQQVNHTSGLSIRTVDSDDPTEVAFSISTFCITFT